MLVLQTWLLMLSLDIQSEIFHQSEFLSKNLFNFDYEFWMLLHDNEHTTGCVFLCFFPSYYKMLTRNSEDYIKTIINSYLSLSQESIALL